MIAHIAVILSFQLIGVVLSRLFLPILPGPVMGMVLCLIAFGFFPKLARATRPTAQVILSHLSLLFVPAGVGVVSHWSVLTADGPALLVAVAISTIIAMLTGALVFVGVARLTGSPH
ncbi:MAG: CidA/LrgA family protein [Pseudomonadota bacterium]